MLNHKSDLGRRRLFDMFGFGPVPADTAASNWLRRRQIQGKPHVTKQRKFANGSIAQQQQVEWAKRRCRPKKPKSVSWLANAQRQALHHVLLFFNLTPVSEFVFLESPSHLAIEKGSKARWIL